MDALYNNIELIRGLNLCNKVPKAMIRFIVYLNKQYIMNNILKFLTR